MRSKQNFPTTKKQQKYYDRVSRYPYCTHKYLADNVYFSKELLANVKTDDIIALRRDYTPKGTVTQAVNLTNGQTIQLNDYPTERIQAWDIIKDFNKAISDPSSNKFYDLFKNAPIKERLYYDYENFKIDTRIRKKLDKIACLTEHVKEMKKIKERIEDLHNEEKVLSDKLHKMEDHYYKHTADVVNRWIDYRGDKRANSPLFVD